MITRPVTAIFGWRARLSGFARGQLRRAALPLFGDRTPHALLNTEFNDGPAQLSPDGRWLAYRSDASGTHEIYVQSSTTLDGPDAAPPPPTIVLNWK